MCVFSVARDGTLTTGCWLEDWGGLFVVQEALEDPCWCLVFPQQGRLGLPVYFEAGSH